MNLCDRKCPEANSDNTQMLDFPVFKRAFIKLPLRSDLELGQSHWNWTKLFLLCRANKLYVLLLHKKGVAVLHIELSDLL